MWKRGSYSMMWNVLLNIVVVFIFVFVPVMVFFNSIITSTYFERNYIAKDLSLVLDTIQASPNNMIYNYVKDTKDFSMDIAENKIEVYSKKKSLGTGTSYYITDPSINLFYEEITPLYETVKNKEKAIPVTLSILKNGNDLRLYNTKKAVFVDNEQDAGETKAPTCALEENEEGWDYFSIYDLSQKDYGGSTLILSTDKFSGYTQHKIKYQSNNYMDKETTLYVHSLLLVPAEGDDFPVVILVHGSLPHCYDSDGDGSFDSECYDRQGYRMTALAKKYVEAGYAVFIPDLQTYWPPEGDPAHSENPLRVPLALDILNLIGSMDDFPMVDSSRIGIVGQSMGGMLAQYALVVGGANDDIDVDAVVLYSSVSTDLADIYDRYRSIWTIDDSYGTPLEDEQGFRSASPLYFLECADAPVQIHHGTEDSEVSIDVSRRLKEKLEENEKEVELYEYVGAGHTFSIPGVAYDTFVERSIEFLDSNVKNG